MPLSTLLQTKFFMTGLIKILIGLAKISGLSKREHQTIIFIILRLDAHRCLKYSLNLDLSVNRLGKANRIKLPKFGASLEVTKMAMEKSLLEIAKISYEPIRISIIKISWTQTEKALVSTQTV